jgi:hypothetical protein
MVQLACLPKLVPFCNHVVRLRQVNAMIHRISFET